MTSKTGKRLLMVFLSAWMVAGCVSIGPRNVAVDRFDYSAAISDSWKQQMLLNLVKTRYGDTPVFLEVASVISQYSLETEANLGASWETPLKSNANTLSVGGSAVYTDRPTITYNPLTGEKFARSLMTPIQPLTILSMIQAGYPVAIIFRLSVQSINGVKNRYGGPARTHGADPGFYPLIEKLGRLQAAGELRIQVHSEKDKTYATLILRRNVGGPIEKDISAVRNILGLDPKVDEYRVSYGSFASSNREIAILSRSVMKIMIDLASTIEVPAEHVAEKRVNPTFRDKTAEGRPVAPLIRIHSSADKPLDAFAAVPYHDRWFWIDDKDHMSKNVFSSMVFIFLLTETGTEQGAPIVTIPAG